jgi:hypothetical protein
METRRLCCKLGCDEPAIYELYYVKSEHSFDDYTDSCPVHIGDLIGDIFVTMVYRIAKDKDA